MAAAAADVVAVRPKLFLGSKDAVQAAELKRLAQLKISHVLSVGSEFPEQLDIKPLRDEDHFRNRIVQGRSGDGRVYLQEGGKKDPFVRMFIPVTDTSAADLSLHFDECRLFISEGLASGGVLVHCVQGRSRSPALIAAFLMMKEKLSLGRALLAIKEKRPQVSPKDAFLEQLRSLESRLGIAPASPRTAAAAGVTLKAERELANPRVFLELSIDGEAAGRVELELFVDRVPKTAENFRCLCTGEKGRGLNGKRLNLLGSTFHKIVPGFLCIGGDFIMGNGTGGESIYGHEFDDESFDVKHDEPGIVSMANSGPDSNGSQFLVCFRPAPQLDGRNVAFGKVVSGWEVVQKIEACGVAAVEEGAEEGVPTRRVAIADCGEVQQADKKVKRAKVASSSEVAWVLHILRKHSGCKKAASLRAESITCSKDEAADFLQSLLQQLSKHSGNAAVLRSEFERLAREHSDCKSAKKGGDLGPFERGMMQKAFEDGAFALAVGGLSEVVSDKNGEHLILRIA